MCISQIFRIFEGERNEYTMKKIIGLLPILFLFVSCNMKKAPVQEKPVQQVVDNARFKMFATDNIWTFLKLDTRTGLIWQVQYSIDESFRGELELNTQSLVSEGETENGRFTLYPTKNMYTFILLDQKDGRMWQTQWSTEAKNRFIIPM